MEHWRAVGKMWQQRHMGTHPLLTSGWWASPQKVGGKAIRAGDSRVLAQRSFHRVLLVLAKRGFADPSSKECRSGTILLYSVALETTDKFVLSSL